MPPVCHYAQLPPEQIARIRLRYESSADAVADIARDEGFSKDQIYAMRRRFHWAPRATPQSRAGARAKAGVNKARAKAARNKRTAKPNNAAGSAPARKRARSSDAPPGTSDVMALVQRLRVALEEELAALQTRAADAPPAERETRARTLASLTRSLASLRAIEASTTKAGEASGQPDDELPLDLAELRRELSRRLDVLREDREDG